MLLYYITDRLGFPGTPAEQRSALLRCLAESARAEVDYIQLREKGEDSANLELLAREALHVVRENSKTTKLLINTHVDIALAIGADGVHLPANASPPSKVRGEWLQRGERAPVIGVSAHSVDEVQRAELDGATFAVFAPVFEKAAAGIKGVGLDALREACAAAGIPVLALGGINLSNAAACLENAAAGIAGIRLFQQANVAATVNALRNLRPTSYAR